MSCNTKTCPSTSEPAPIPMIGMFTDLATFLANFAGIFSNTIAKHPAFSEWPLIVVTDEPVRAAKSSMNFLWTTFTRFEPAADVYAASTKVVRNHLAYSAPIVIDARLKPSFPEELRCQPDVATRVSSRWREYFPQAGVEMGDAERGHLD